MLPFFLILTAAMKAIAGGLVVYKRRVPADTATASRVAYIVECLEAAINKKPLPKLGGQ